MQAGNVCLLRNVKVVGNARYGDIATGTRKIGCEILDSTTVQHLDDTVLAGKSARPVGTTSYEGTFNTSTQSLLIMCMLP